MGLIKTAAKIGAKKDQVKEGIGEAVDATKQKYTDTKQKVSDFSNDPRAFLAQRYAAEKAQASADIKNSATESDERQRLLKKQEQEEDVKLKNAREGGKIIGGMGGGSSGSPELSTLKLIFWISFAIHVCDAFTGAQRPSTAVLISYGVLFIISAIFVFKRELAEEGGLLIAVTLAYFLPQVTKLSFIVNLAATSNIASLTAGLIILIPVVPLYLAFHFPEHARIKKLAMGVVTFWVIVFMISAIGALASDQNAKKMINDPMMGVKYAVTWVYDVFGKFGTSVSNSFKRAVAEATGQPYEGEQESQVGIYVEEVKPLETKYTIGSRVFIEAKIKAINLKEQIAAVHTVCYIEGLKNGNVSPDLMINVSDNYENIIDCDLGQLKEGTYEVKVRADFEFETTSDITYTFVSTGVKSDQYPKLGIDPQAIATYTGGPVELGLPSLTQPLRVEPQSGNVQPGNYPFGASLRNTWPQGKVMKGLWYVLNTPKEVQLIDCSRNPDTTQETDPVTDRNVYRFEANTSRAQDYFDAVTCRMQFTDVTSLLGNDLKSVKTFAARSRYLYAVEGTTSVTVEKN